MFAKSQRRRKKYDFLYFAGVLAGLSECGCCDWLGAAVMAASTWLILDHHEKN